MVLLGVAVAIVGVLCLLDMLLTFGVIRRLREHTELLSRIGNPGLPVLGLAQGAPVGAFTATTMDGEQLNGASGFLAAGFFSSSCSVCPERVGPFAAYLRQHQIPRENAISVAAVTGGSRPAYLDELAEVSVVCVESGDGQAGQDGQAAAAFKVQGFPAFCLLDGAGTVLAANYDPAALPAPAVAP